MATYVCVRKCIFRNRRWRVGETLVAGKDEKVPKHFVPASEAPAKVVEESPVTFKGMQDAERQSKPKTGMAAKPKAKSKGKNKPEDPFE